MITTIPLNIYLLTAICILAPCMHTHTCTHILSHTRTSTHANALTRYTLIHTHTHTLAYVHTSYIQCCQAGGLALKTAQLVTNEILLRHCSAAPAPPSHTPSDTASVVTEHQFPDLFGHLVREQVT